MKNISTTLERMIAGALVALMALIVLDVSWQVITRFLINRPSSYTEEIARYLLMWIGLLGAAYAYRKHSHLSLDLLLQKVSFRYRIALAMLIHVVSFVFALLVMVYGGAKLVELTWSLKQTSAALGMPVAVVYLCLPVSGALICWFALDNFIDPKSTIRECSE